MNRKVLIFDLDDTLYPEIEYVYSGFKSVSVYLGKLSGEKANRIFVRLKEILIRQGRGKVFDTILKELNLFSLKNKNNCVQVYRQHVPDISLYPGVAKLLNTLRKKHSLYVVTDGNKLVQDKKSKALLLERYFKKVFITYRYGLVASKPSIHCFEIIRKMEQCNFAEMVYIGDNPRKDFVNCKSAGMFTIRILMGEHRLVKVAPDYEADVSINNVLELINYID